MLTRALPVLATALALSTLAACGGDDETAQDAATCSYPSDPAAAAKAVEPPPGEPTVHGQVTATVATTVGELHLNLDADGAPCTVSSFVSLAEQGYYDSAPCHRMAVDPTFAFLQCGDPSGTGTGGPGYTIPDEYDGSETYPAGTLAMANQGRPDTGGGQFFMVFGDTELAPTYTVFGTLDEKSIALLQKVGKAGVTNVDPTVGGGEPKRKVTFAKVTID